LKPELLIAETVRRAFYIVKWFLWQQSSSSGIKVLKSKKTGHLTLKKQTGFMTDKKLKWGIIGLGNIAHKFAADLLLCEKAQLLGVASRSKEKAHDFAKKYHAVKHYGSYRELAEDPDIDVVYIATPHPMHFENTLMCLKNGKHVLCEKPMGMNRNQVETMIKEARSDNLFLMEALWSRFIPSTFKLLELLNKDVIGKISFIRADFGFKADWDPQWRVYNKSLGGGSLLDIGIYPIYLSLLLLGNPVDIKAMARMSETEVDTFVAMLFDFRNGEKAVLESTVEADTPTEAYIYGEKGTIKLHTRFHHTTRITLIPHHDQEQTYEIGYRGNGYYHEIKEVSECIGQNSTESELFSHNDSLNLIATMDAVRKEIGLDYS
jgi:predicted dehydrogenase